MKLLLSSIVLATLTVFAQSSFNNESNLRVLKAAKKSVKAAKGSKDEKSVTTKNLKIGKSVKNEKEAKVGKKDTKMGKKDKKGGNTSSIPSAIPSLTPTCYKSKGSSNCPDYYT